MTDVEVDYSNLPKIIARDKGLRPLKATEMNIGHLGWLDYISVEKSDFFKSQQSDEKFHIVMNPPYDERLRERDIVQFYQFIGDTLKSAYTGSEAWIITGNEEGLKSIGLRASRRISMMNGPIPSKFCKFEMYSGTRKTKGKDKAKNNNDRSFDKGSDKVNREKSNFKRSNRDKNDKSKDEGNYQSKRSNGTSAYDKPW